MDPGEMGHIRFIYYRIIISNPYSTTLYVSSIYIIHYICLFYLLHYICYLIY